MSQPNYTALGIGLKVYLEAMRRFVRDRLESQYATRWWDDGVQRNLTEAQRQNLDWDTRRDPARDRHDFLDPQHLTSVVTREFDRAFAGVFGDYRKTQALLQLIAAARNDYAHPRTGDLSEDEVSNALFNMQQILTSAGLTEASVIRSLRESIGRRRLNNSSAGAAAAPRVNLEDAITNADALSAKDVAQKRVLCPACESFVFQMWPGGWDGHSGWKCTGVVGDTPEERKADFRRKFGHLFRKS